MLQKHSYLSVFKELLLTDLHILRGTLFDQMFNLIIWASTQIIVASYLMPLLGMSSAFSSFMLVGLCASAGLFGIFPNVALMISDFEGDQVFAYYLTLPIPSWMVFFRLIIYYALNYAFLGALVLPVGKLLIWNQFDASTIHWDQFAVMFILTHFFYGAFTLWIASRVRNMTKMSNAWMRFVYPIWFMGGFQFSWYMLESKWPYLAWLNLFNPMTYIMEGMRGAVLGQTGYLNVWLCACMLTVFTILCSWRGIMRLKQRLDFV